MTDRKQQIIKELCKILYRKNMKMLRLEAEDLILNALWLGDLKQKKRRSIFQSIYRDGGYFNRKDGSLALVQGYNGSIYLVLSANKKGMLKAFYDIKVKTMNDTNIKKGAIIDIELVSKALEIFESEGKSKLSINKIARILVDNDDNTLIKNYTRRIIRLFGNPKNRIVYKNEDIRSAEGWCKHWLVKV